MLEIYKRTFVRMQATIVMVTYVAYNHTQSRDVALTVFAVAQLGAVLGAYLAPHLRWRVWRVRGN